MSVETKVCLLDMLNSTGRYYIFSFYMERDEICVSFFIYTHKERIIFWLVCMYKYIWKNSPFSEHIFINWLNILNFSIYMCMHNFIYILRSLISIQIYLKEYTFLCCNRKSYMHRIFSTCASVTLSVVSTSHYNRICAFI